VDRATADRPIADRPTADRSTADRTTNRRKANYGRGGGQIGGRYREDGIHHPTQPTLREFCFSTNN